MVAHVDSLFGDDQGARARAPMSLSMAVLRAVKGRGAAWSVQYGAAFARVRLSPIKGVRRWLQRLTVKLWNLPK